MRELRGQRCLNIENNATAKKQIVVSRSFGTGLQRLKTLRPIVSNFAVRVAEKLRNERQNALKFQFSLELVRLVIINLHTGYKI